MHRALALLTAPLLLTACELVPANEVDNPRLFHVQAVHHAPAGRTTYEDFTATFRCLRYTCDEDPEPTRAAFKWSGEPAPPPPDRAERCRCAGSYVLEGPGGLSIGFLGLDALAPGTHLTSEDGDLAIFYDGKPGNGAAHVSRLSQLRLAGGRDFAYDAAGGFEVQVGPHRFLSGFFYSVLPEDE
jgi:hypothetical protein